MRVTVQRTVELRTPGSEAWAYVADWPRQREWIPMTRVEVVDSGDRVGGRIRAWTGIGPVGFWDSMTITELETTASGGTCSVLHTGKVVRGTGRFAIVATGESTCLFEWSETLDVPFGAVGRVGWAAGGRALFMLVVERALASLRRRLEATSYE